MKLPVILSAVSGTLVPFVTLAEAGKSVSSTLAPSPLAGGALLETAGGLLLILVLIFALGWLVRRFGRLPLASKGEIAVLSGVSLGPRERAVLLRVGDTRLLVGVAPGRVQTLYVLEKESSGSEQTDLFSARLESEITEQEK